MKAKRKVTARRRLSRRPALSLSARIERLEKTVLFPRQEATFKITMPRFSNLDAQGNPTSGDHVAVRDNKTGLIWSAAPIGGSDGLNHADAMKACSALDLLGQKDWRAPTIQELLSIVDYTKNDPAVDKTHFKGPYGWTWTSTPYAGNPAGYAWYVYLHNGNAYYYYHSYQFHVRAVCAGQQLGLSV